MQHFLEGLDARFDYAFNVTSSVHPLGIGFAGFLNLYRIEDASVKLLYRRIVWESSYKKQSFELAHALNEGYFFDKYEEEQFTVDTSILYLLKNHDAAIIIFSLLAFQISAKNGYSENIAPYFLQHGDPVLNPVTMAVHEDDSYRSPEMYIVRDSYEAAKNWLTILKKCMASEKLYQIQACIKDPSQLQLEYTKADIDEMDNKFSELKQELYRNLARAEKENQTTSRLIKAYQLGEAALKRMDPVDARHAIDGLNDVLGITVRIYDFKETDEQFDRYTYDHEQIIRKRD